MNSDRLKKIGIQRELRLDWFDQAARFHAMGFPKNAARQEIYTYLDSAAGFGTPPSIQTKTYIANILIKSWISPERELIELRDAAFRILQENPEANLALHWCLLGSAYPFWFAVAATTGRLLNLQEQVTHRQIVSRLKERFGDRETVTRRARYVIRSFVAWGVLKDSSTRGCYEKSAVVDVADMDLALLMLESMLLTTQEGRSAFQAVLVHPALFPFQLPMMTGNLIAQRSPRINVERYGLDDEMLTVKAVHGATESYREKTNGND
jgi:hypothetical protein